MNIKKALILACYLVVLLSCNPLEEKNFITPRPVAIAPDKVSSVSFIARWNKVLIADEYTLEVAKDKDFNTILNQTTVKDTSAVQTGLEVNTSYFYRVSFKTGAIKSQASNVIPVNTLPFQQPIALPAVNTDQVSFLARWHKVIGAEKYLISVSETSDFSQLLTNFDNRVIADTSLLVQNLKANKDYYYKVKAVYKNETSDYSNTIKLITLGLNVPLAKDARDINYMSFLAQWGKVALSQSYLIDVATDAQFTNIVSGYNQKETLDSSLNINNLNPDTKYYYRVKSKGLSSISDASNIVSVQTSSLISPQGVKETTKTEFSFSISWNMVDGADNYVVQIASDPLFTSLIKETTETQTQSSMMGLKPNTLYYYRVLSQRNQIRSSTADVKQIKTNALPTAFNVTASNISQFEFTLTWDLAGSIVDYEVDVSLDPNFVANNIVIARKFSGNTAVFRSLTPRTTYYYRVRSILSGFISENTPTASLQTTAIESPLALNVSNKDHDVFDITFRWNPVSTGGTYVYEIAEDPDFKIILSSPTTSEVATNYTVFRTFNFKKTFYFRLRTKYLGYYSDYSNVITVNPIVGSNCFFYHLDGTQYIHEFTFDTDNRVSTIVDENPIVGTKFIYKIFYESNNKVSSIERWNDPVQSTYIEKWNYTRDANNKVNLVSVYDSNNQFLRQTVLTIDPSNGWINKMETFSDINKTVLLTAFNYSYNSDGELTTIKNGNNSDVIKILYDDYLNPYATLDQDIALAIRYNSGVYLPFIPVRIWAFEKLISYPGLSSYQQSYSYLDILDGFNNIKIPVYRYASKQLNYKYTNGCNFAQFKQ